RSPRRDHPHRAGRLTKVERLNEKGATVTLLRKRSCLPVGWRRSTMPRASCWAVLVVSWTTAPTACAPARYAGDCVGMSRPEGGPWAAAPARRSCRSGGSGDAQGAAEHLVNYADDSRPGGGGDLGQVQGAARSEVPVVRDEDHGQAPRGQHLVRPLQVRTHLGGVRDHRDDRASQQAALIVVRVPLQRAPCAEGP